MKTSKIYIGVGSVLVLGLLLISVVSAFTVSSEYWRENPLRVMPGPEGKEGIILLQNVGSDNDLTVRMSLDAGSDVIEFIDQSDTYIVPAGGKTKVNFRATLPSDATEDDVYPVSIVFTGVTETSPGEFSFGMGIGWNFDVVMVTAPVEEPELAPPIDNKTIILVVLAVIVLIVIVWFILRSKKKGAKSNKS